MVGGFMVTWSSNLQYQRIVAIQLWGEFLLYFGDFTPWRHDPWQGQSEFQTMKTIPYILLPVTTLILTALLLAACDERKASIDAKAEAKKEILNQEKVAVDQAAEQAKKQTDINATMDKANIEATKASEQADLDAAKKKADADAIAEKARLDALRK
jgi:hypothetical protein